MSFRSLCSLQMKFPSLFYNLTSLPLSFYISFLSHFLSFFLALSALCLPLSISQNFGGVPSCWCFSCVRVSATPYPLYQVYITAPRGTKTRWFVYRPFGLLSPGSQPAELRYPARSRLMSRPLHISQVEREANQTSCVDNKVNTSLFNCFLCVFLAAKARN